MIILDDDIGKYEAGRTTHCVFSFWRLVYSGRPSGYRVRTTAQVARRRRWHPRHQGARFCRQHPQPRRPGGQHAAHGARLSARLRRGPAAPPPHPRTRRAPARRSSGSIAHVVRPHGRCRTLPSDRSSRSIAHLMRPPGRCRTPPADRCAPSPRRGIAVGAGGRWDTDTQGSPIDTRFGTDRGFAVRGTGVC